MSSVSVHFSFLIFFSCFVYAAFGALVGIDVGNAFFKVATVSSRRAVDIVPNAQSERKTPTVVSFAEDTREFGFSAIQYAVRYPSDVVTMIPSFLGYNVSNELNASFPLVDPFHPLHWTRDSARGVPKITLPRRNVTLGPEELASHLFQHIHNMVDGGTQKTKLDAVFTVPEGYGMRQRQALIHAASLANITVLGLIRETPAAALHHALDLPLGFIGKKLFINVGAWRVQVCVVEYGRSTASLVGKGSVKKTPPDVDVIHCEESVGVGGRQCDLLLSQVITDIAQEKFHADIRSHPRVLQRIYQQAERTKNILSTNKAANVFVENLYKGFDFQTRITRESFEQLIQPVVNRTTNVVRDTLSRANVTLQELSGVEVVGGAWRIPAIQRALVDAVKPHFLGQHVNADEGMAFGATLVAANLSSLVRLRPIRYTEGASHGYSVMFRHRNNMNGSSRVIVPIGGRLSGFRTVSLKTCDPIEGFLWELNSDGSEALLESYNITGTTELCQNEFKAFGLPKVSIIFTINPLGFVALDRAVAQWEETYLASVPVTTTTTLSTSTSSAAKSDSSTASTAPGSTPKKAAETTTTTTEAPRTEMVEKTRKRTRRCTVLTSEYAPTPLSNKAISDARHSLIEFTRIDNLAALLAKTQNELESYIYNHKGALTDDAVVAVTDEKTRMSVNELLEEAQEWLYSDEARSATTVEPYEEKMRKLREIIDPISFRASEIEKRRLVGSGVVKMERQVQRALSQKNMVLDSNATQALQQQWESFQSWYNQMVDLQAKQALTEQPAYQSDEVQRRLEIVRHSTETVYKTAKPIPKVVENLTANTSSQAHTTPNATVSSTPASNPDTVSSSSTSSSSVKPKPSTLSSNREEL